MAVTTSIVSTSAHPAAPRTHDPVDYDSKALLKNFAANEIVFAVVGHVGSGTSEIAEFLKSLLEDKHLDGGPYETSLLKARDEISAWAKENHKDVPDPASKDLRDVTTMQNLGDSMRLDTRDHAAIARALVRRIRATRAAKLGKSAEEAGPIAPDGRRRAYILDSLRHPAEVELLRGVYQDAFVLIGVVCDEKVRERRVVTKYKNAGQADAREFMERDAKAPEKHGQRVADAFHLSDFFIDNTSDRFLDGTPRRSNPGWRVNDELARLARIVTHALIVRPTSDETGMYHAYGAQMRSACLSRQVGAALIDTQGNVVATGTNEVPRAGGGLYGEGFDASAADYRCAFQGTEFEAPFCSNTRQQNDIIEDLINKIPEMTQGKSSAELAEFRRRLRSTRIGVLIEFSRAVHAEMAAILSAARKGVSPIACRLFVTTFPCHYCARHLVAAGVEEVQFIEPYLKSQAFALHEDAITLNPAGWKAPREAEEYNKTKPATAARVEPKVLFRPFTGVAPRLYRRAFLKDRDLKDDMTGAMRYGDPEWGSAWQLRSASYVDVEARLAMKVSG